jgi:leucyl-tRNA synthetase
MRQDPDASQQRPRRTLERAAASPAYVFACPPFTSGRLHLGHARSYCLADAIARYLYSDGRSVLWSMAFDAFGLPNEMAAIRAGTSPDRWVAACVARMRSQLDLLDLAVDWSRTFVTSEPTYYRWTQWTFLQFYRAGLVYADEALEPWCDGCQVVLADAQITDQGQCWRCASVPRLAVVRQWYVALSALAERLDRGLAALPDLDRAVRACQTRQIGRTAGCEIDLVADDGSRITAFTAAEPIAASEFVLLPPNHAVARRWRPLRAWQELLAAAPGGRATDGTPPIVDSGHTVTFGSRRLPVLVTGATRLRYGATAELGIPGADHHDRAVAAAVGLVWCASSNRVAPPLPVRRAIRYRLRDFSVSRQRCWGAPVPLVECGGCGVVPVAEDQLPVELPAGLRPAGSANPLAEHPTFPDCACPRCGCPARRETQTLDCHVDSFWMLIPFCVPPGARAASMMSHPALARWLPAVEAVCGVDQASWWINDRACFHVLRGLGHLAQLPDDEPLRRVVVHDMVLQDGRKMSKSAGNAVRPDEIIRRHGADALRLALLGTDARRPVQWCEARVDAAKSDLARLDSLVEEVAAAARAAGDARSSSTSRSRIRRWAREAVRRARAAYERRQVHTALFAARRLLTLLVESWQSPESRTGPGLGAMRTACASLLRILEPLAPGACRAAWDRLGLATRLDDAGWPDNLEAGWPEPRASPPASSPRAPAATSTPPASTT